MEEGRQSDAKYKELSIQGKTSMEIDGKICGAICDREGSIIKCGKIMITKMRIHLVVNMSRIVRYKEQVKGQKKEEGKLVEVEGFEEWEVKKILNKKKIRGVEKYLVQWKVFTVEHDTWERKEDLGNVEEVLEEFKERMNVEVRMQERIDMAEERDFRRGELLEKFMARMLYGWDDGKFEEEYLKKLERNWRR